MVESTPFLIAVAPNGAQKSQASFPGLPITPKELANTASDCLEAGAAMMHLHVRDSVGRHTIMPEYYLPALEEIDKAVGDRMVIQVSSEAANLYNRHQQMQAVRSLMPAAVSIALKELVPDETAYDDAANLFSDLETNGCLIQYILYNPDDVARYHELIERKVIPRSRNLILFVLGQYGVANAKIKDLESYVARNRSDSPWMCCAFGPNELPIMNRVVEMGGHARVGFENNTLLASGRQADSNSQLVMLTARAARDSGRPLANAKWLRRLHTDLLNDD